MIVVLRALVLATGLSVISLLLIGSAEAKQPSFIITGGELGKYAAHINALVLNEEDPFVVQLPGQDSHSIAAPSETPGPVYDVWQQIGFLDAMPLLEFYPDAGLMRLKRSDTWYKAGPSTLEFLRYAVDYALEMKDAGGLEDGVQAAQLRATRLAEATFFLRPYAVPGQGYNFVGSGECPGCVSFSTGREEFVMRHLMEVLDGPLVGPAPEMPPYAIEFEIVEPPSGRIAGLLGMYRLPERDQPGQFWLEHYSRDTLYRETTPGFDAVIAEALERAERWQGAPADNLLLGDGSDGGILGWVWTAILASIAGAALAGGAILYRRRAS